MRFIRIVLDRKIPINGAREGFFQTAYALRRSGDMAEEQLVRLNECLNYLDDHIHEPPRFSKSISKGADRRETKGLSWFKVEASHVVGKAMELARLFQELGLQTTVLRTDRVGYVVYEDDVQIVAEPFTDTLV